MYAMRNTKLLLLNAVCYVRTYAQFLPVLKPRATTHVRTSMTSTPVQLLVRNCVQLLPCNYTRAYLSCSRALEGSTRLLVKNYQASVVHTCPIVKFKLSCTVLLHIKNHILVWNHNGFDHCRLLSAGKVSKTSTDHLAAV